MSFSTEIYLLSFNSPMCNGCFQATLVLISRVQNQTGLFVQIQLSLNLSLSFPIVMWYDQDQHWDIFVKLIPNQMNRLKAWLTIYITQTGAITRIQLFPIVRMDFPQEVDQHQHCDPYIFLHSQSRKNRPVTKMQLLHHPYNSPNWCKQTLRHNCGRSFKEQRSSVNGHLLRITNENAALGVYKFST